ncbi:glycosyltransferase [Kribbella sp. CA-293567]|uniref:glycosyltransferase n=1 Tax=Kribbella sp. CA-293567 TaxID=3002436 RepID=UPI0022DD81D9|nr:glycosyltransferase [Kribbella sp. CA-293567]WBQ08308.1 glycosyltransferase [Kribbella sp. CA-293567]
MRIAMVSEHASPLAVLGGADAGGQNVHVAALALALAELGHEVEVYTRRDDVSSAETVPLGPGVDVIHVPAGPPRAIPKDELHAYMPAFGDWLASRWLRRRPEVVHAHFWMSGLACAQARRSIDFPFAQTFHALGVVKRRHQGADDTSPPERQPAEKRLAYVTDAVIATATEEVHELLRLGARPESLHVVPCGVELFEGTTATDGWWNQAGGRVLSLGRLVERKGVDTVIAAMAALPDAELVVAGGPAGSFESDPEVRRLRRLAQRLGVADRVRLVGAVTRDQVPGLLRSADVVACTPWYEPFGIVPLEAMACARPVVGSAVGGLLDTVVDGVTGILVPPKEPGRLAEALGGLLADPEQRRRLGLAGATRVAEKYTWAAVAAETEAVYRQITTAKSIVVGRAH